MANEAKQYGDFPERTSAQANDLFLVCRNPEANANLVSVSVANFFGNSMPANVALSNTAVFSANTQLNRKLSTPANSTITVTQGTWWFDADYLYVATANNTLKRVALAAF